MIERDYINNQGLFSNNYLAYRLCEIPVWNDQKQNAEESYKKIKSAYENIKNLKLGAGQEAELEDKFIRPVLYALGYEYSVQPISNRGYKKKRPDYALFKDNDSYAEAKSQDDYKKLFYHALTILEAKYWGRRLNDNDREDLLDSRDPTAQTIKYLEDVHYHSEGKIDWAILTNGKKWRLFYYKSSYRAATYYEIDLEELIERQDTEGFLYFFLFFSKYAFSPEALDKQSWLDIHLSESQNYAKAVSDRLKDFIFDEVFEGLAKGIIHYRNNELKIDDETEENKTLIFKACLTLLYRILFLLYAESRNLLPIDKTAYRNISLSKLKDDIYNDLKHLSSNKMSKRSYVYWARFEGLCDIIAKGDSSLNVPLYNGGLFDASENDFLKKHKISDPFFAIAIEKLTIEQGGAYPPEITPFIDYSSLSVRHLGDIYEGLLEFHLRIADDEIAEVRDDDKYVWKKISDVKEKTKVYRRKQKGEIYIENSKHERKSSGSYYTPHYIVEYIVDNTIGSLLNQKFDKARESLTELDSLYDKQRKNIKKSADWKHWEHKGEPQGQYIDEIEYKERYFIENLFNLKVLDPAMGSGHFLVHAVDFISNKIAAFLVDYPDNPAIRKIEEMRDEILHGLQRQNIKIDESKLTEVNLIKRMVIKQCVYGIDLNEMAVELAKLSLWLDSFTLGAPLSFLDHHLKCGNSLIGVNVEEVINALGQQQTFFEKSEFSRMLLVVDLMRKAGELSDVTPDMVKKSRSEFKKANDALEPARKIMDIYTSRWFGNEPKASGKGKHKTERDNALLFLRSQEHADWAIGKNHKLLDIDKKIVEIANNAAESQCFFHWEIEFPEVFFGPRPGTKNVIEKLANAGFDAVIGNPPYDVISEDIFMKRSIARGTKNLFGHFIAKGTELAKEGGNFGFVVPLSFSCGENYEKIRQKIYSRFAKLKTSHYSIRPAKLFPHVDQRITIFIASEKPLKGCHVSSSRLYRFNDGQQEELVLHPETGDVGILQKGYIPRVANPIGASVYRKLLKIKSTIGDFVSKEEKSDCRWWFHSVGRYWIKAYNFLPLFSRDGEKGISTDTIELKSVSKKIKLASICVINSSLFYYWWMLQSDEFHLLKSQVLSMPLPELLVEDKDLNWFVTKLMKDYKKKAIKKTIKAGGKNVFMEEIHARLSKEIILEIDDFLAPYFGLTKKELAFLKEYDMDFRSDDD